MLGKSLASPLLTFGSATPFCFSVADLSTAKPNIVLFNVNFSNGLPQDVLRGARSTNFSPKKWAIHSTAQIENLTLSNEDRKTWEACRQALSAFSLSVEEEDKILGKAFGQFHSPYWGEERKREVPKFEIVNEVLDYLRGLSLSNDDICKLLKKFPEVLGCGLEHELKSNVQILEKEWGIKGKSLRNLLLETRKCWVIMLIVREIAWHNALDVGFGFSCLLVYMLFSVYKRDHLTILKLMLKLT